jgi:hypothetical protein
MKTPKNHRALKAGDKFKASDVGRMSNGDLLPVASHMLGRTLTKADAQCSWFRPLPKKITPPTPLQTACVHALNKAGLSDQGGSFYPEANAHNVTAFILRKARANLKP